VNRRRFLQLLGLATGGFVVPGLWLPKPRKTYFLPLGKTVEPHSLWIKWTLYDDRQFGCEMVTPAEFTSEDRAGWASYVCRQDISTPGLVRSFDGIEIYDANPGGANTILQLVAYGEIANEIYDELRDAPAAIAVSVSNGTTLAGIHRGFATLYRRGKTSRIPRIIAGSSHGKNPIVRSFLKGYDECRDLDPATVRETEVNEPLINWHSFDGDWALDAVRTSAGFADDASDREMLRQAKVLREREGLSVLPASTAGLAVLLQRHVHNPFPGDRYVAVLTGRR